MVIKTIVIRKYKKYFIVAWETKPIRGIVIIKINGNTFLKKASFNNFEVSTFSHTFENTTEDTIPAIIRAGTPYLANSKTANPILEIPSSTLVIECNSFLYKVVTSTILFGSTDA